MIGSQIEFANPEFFWLFLLLPVAVLWYWLRRRKLSAILQMPSLSGFGKPSLLARLYPILPGMRLLALAAVIVAMARPQNPGRLDPHQDNQGDRHRDGHRRFLEHAGP